MGKTSISDSLMLPCGATIKNRIDNSALESDLIAEKKQNRAFNVYQLEKFNTLKFIADER